MHVPSFASIGGALALTLLGLGGCGAKSESYSIACRVAGRGDYGPCTQFSLLDGKSGRAARRFQGEAQLAAADLEGATHVAVWKRGAEVMMLDIQKWVDRARLQVDLDASVDSASLRLAEGGAEDRGVRLDLSFKWRAPWSANDAKPDIYVHEELGLGVNTTTVPVYRSGHVVVFAMDMGFIWPRAVELFPGAVTELHAEALAIRTIAVPEGRGLEYAKVAFCTPDESNSLGWSPQKIDGYRSWAIGGPLQVTWDHSHVMVEAPRDLPLHMFFGGTVASYTHVGAGALKTSVGSNPPRELASAVAMGDDTPLPDGSYVFPGTLDLRTISLLLAGGRKYDSCWSLLSSRRLVRSTLPWARAYTAWHPKQGLSELRIGEEDRLVGRRLPGSVTLHFEGGGTFSGRVVITGWVGTSSVQLFRDSDPTALAFEGVSEITLPGLALGTVSIGIAGTRVSEDGESSVVKVQVSAELTERARDSVIFLSKDGGYRRER